MENTKYTMPSIPEIHTTKIRHIIREKTQMMCLIHFLEIFSQ